MGCDIHCFIEIKNDCGVWDCHDWDARLREGNWGALFDHPLYLGRNYSLFSILANVRNGYGFAGCDTGEGFVPISMPRGLPDDVSEKVRAESDEWDMDGHSHSWVTLRELLDYDWNQITVCHGIVSMSEYRRFKVEGKPSSWCGGISGRDIRHVDNAEMDRLLTTINSDEKVYTQIEWKESYADCVNKFLTKTIPALQEFGKPDDVRLVFFFDN